jgi:hypothetical protein
MSERVCLVNGCTSAFKLVKGLCSRHYQQSLKGVSVAQMQEACTVIDVIPQPPKPPADKKRCHAIMTSGKRCIRGIRGRGLCGAHFREENDRFDMEIRERPLDAARRDWEGNEAALIAALENRNA